MTETDWVSVVGSVVGALVVALLAVAGCLKFMSSKYGSNCNSTPTPVIPVNGQTVRDLQAIRCGIEEMTRSLQRVEDVISDMKGEVQQLREDLRR